MDVQKPDASYEVESTIEKIKELLSNRKSLVIFSIGILLVLLIFGSYLLLIKKTQSLSEAPLYKTFTPPQPTKTIAVPNDKVIAKVGEENIYQSDLDRGTAYYPPVTGEEAKSAVLDKLISDSIILQEGGKEKIATLTAEIYNSPTKDNEKRLQAVENIKKTIEDQAERIEGSVISIWFYNNEVGKLGYEAGKQLAFEKIFNMYREVKNGTITMREAGNTIKNDNSLADIDISYYANAIFDFDSNRSEKITFDDEFNKVLWGLHEGELSDIYLVKDKNYKTGIYNDAVYMFGQVSKKVINENKISYDNWYEQIKENYEVKYY